MLHVIAEIVLESVLQDLGVAPAESDWKAAPQSTSPIGIMVDASSDSARREQCIIFARLVVRGEVATRFLGIKELANGDAASYLKVIWELIDELKVDRNRVFWLGTDGAGPMIGQHAGLGALMRRVIPFLLSNHCIDHRLVAFCVFVSLCACCVVLSAWFCSVNSRCVCGSL